MNFSTNVMISFHYSLAHICTCYELTLSHKFNSLSMYFFSNDLFLTSKAVEVLHQTNTKIKFLIMYDLINRKQDVYETAALVFLNLSTKIISNITTTAHKKQKKVFPSLLLIHSITILISF